MSNKIDVGISATDAGFTSTIKKVNDSTKTLDDSVKKVASNVTASFGSMVKAGAALAVSFGAVRLAGAAFREVFEGFGEALDLGGRLSDLSARTGESAGNLLILERAFNNTGIGADKVGSAVNKLQRFIVEAGQGAATQSKVMSQLGLSMTDLANMTPTEQMRVLAERISRIENPTERAAVAMQVFGKSGGELLPFLTNFSSELINAQSELGSLPSIMDRNANAFDAISDKISVVRGKVSEFSAGLLESAIPALNKLVNAGSELNAANFGQIVGQKLSEAFELITSGDIWEIFRLNAEKAINNIRTSGAINNLAAFLNTVFDGITGGLDFNWDETFEKYKNAGIAANTDVNDAINNQISAIWDKQKERAVETAKAFEGEMQEAAANSAIMLKDIPEVTPISKDLPKWLERLPDATNKANKDSESIKGSLEKGADAISKAAADVEKAMTLSDELQKSLDDAVKKEQIDPGGKTENKINEAIARGDFTKAQRDINKLFDQEIKASAKDLFAEYKKMQKFEEQKGLGGDFKDIQREAEREQRRAMRMSPQDMAKELGIEIGEKKRSELMDAINEELKKRKQQKDDPTKKGEKEAEKVDKQTEQANALKDIVQKIHDLCAKIEPKLPQTALGF